MKRTLIAVATLSTLLAAPAFSHEQGTFLFRFGAAGMLPNEGRDDVLGAGEFKIDDNYQLGLTFGYMLTDNIAVELLAATPFKHTVSLNGVGDITEIKHLPPTLMLEYYFGNAQSQWRPYAGIGLNYTTFFDESLSSTAQGLGLSDISLDDSWGVAVNVGLDYQINDRWFVGGSLWWADINTDVNVKVGGTPASISTEVDPWVVMLSAGYKF
ncbi:outer membrane protein OmpW [Aliagarivorans taiwanensis]|uniref:outer membrane protein OmpW n=1 Tax=Aliagarivorans taiwanensis TaxID=561966 RepID=UPI0003F60E16|nr:outer membrane protein OmpW [Aliagarivorans taiwanensis]